MSETFDLESIAAALAFGSSRVELADYLGQQPGAPVIVQAPPGSGKTTIVPPVTADAVGAGKVIVTQPRRVAARAAARRLSSLIGEPLGQRVGYAVRGERKVSGETRIEFVTAGLLLRRLLADPEMSGVSAVVLDEVHERSIDTDLLLAMLVQVAELRGDLTLVVMSATLEAGDLRRLLQAAGPVREVHGHTAQHPVQERFEGFSGARTNDYGLRTDYLEHVAKVAVQETRANNAQDDVYDTLVFVPGVREAETVAGRIGTLGGQALVLHGQIPPRAQDEILSEPAVGTPPRIIVATAIAESSLTVPRVNLVIDAGYAREPRRDTVRGVSGLMTVVASRAAATQRAGRAGRLVPGTVVRTLDERSFAAADPATTAEIRTADLVQAGLYLAAWGTPRGEGLELWQQPPAEAMRGDEQVLRSLGAVDAEGKITATGRRMLQIPADPRTARALLDGAAHCSADRIARATAVLTGGYRAEGADALALAQTLERGDHREKKSYAAEVRRFEALLNTSQSPKPSSGPTESTHAGSLNEALATVMILAYPQWVARRMAPGEYLLASGTRAQLPPGSPLQQHEYLAVGEVQRSGPRTLIRLAAATDLEQVLQLEPQLHTRDERATFRAGKLSARRIERFGAIELASHPVPVTKELAVPAVQAALAEQRLGLFGEQPQFEALRRRLAVAHRLAGEPFGPMDESSLIAAADQWLGGVLEAVAGGTPAGNVDLREALRALIPWEHAHDFDELVPTELQVPSGSRIQISYPPVDEQGPAVVAVKLQECFSMTEPVRLVRGQLPVQFHLLSPAGRPLAVTEDVPSFFSGPYRQVRAEMRGRYPKHPWPEDPMSHEPTKLTNRRLRS
ncbi:ATP-dependent helicase HrpB [Glutamicibacter sp. PS]|uniref:ATP-dependent helicase HrpB n=1 Tax=Glutamicibacter sp. PS TaxID=3075634 RepID=UPI00283CE8F7|nr:ATP-dependent helicase HrpB [Glutamicibacter sp. PS]MDR4531907.1 ATP-dependent helicase HrpB [Glutamicibacter sp. PS]